MLREMAPRPDQSWWRSAPDYGCVLYGCTYPAVEFSFPEKGASTSRRENTTASSETAVRHHQHRQRGLHMSTATSVSPPHVFFILPVSLSEWTACKVGAWSCPHEATVANSIRRLIFETRRTEELKTGALETAMPSSLPVSVRGPGLPMGGRVSALMMPYIRIRTVR